MSLSDDLRGEIIQDESTLEKYSTNYGGILRGRPLGIFRPENEGDISLALKSIRTSGTPLAIRGAGHSCEAHCIATDGLVLETLNADSHAVFHGDDLVEVPAGMTWHALELELYKRGRSVTVYTTPMSTTVGGTIAVGGIGPRSLHQGLQCDAVERLLLTRPDGTSIWCSPESERELFLYTLAGLGQTGCIERVTLRTIAARPLRLETRFFKSPMELAESMAPLATLRQHDPSGPAEFHGKISREGIQGISGLEGQGRSMDAQGDEVPGEGARETIVETCESTPLKYHREISDWSARFTEHARLWTDFVFNYRDFRVFMEFLDEHLKASPLDRVLDVVWILPIRVGANRPVFAPLPAEPEDVVFSVGLYNMIPRWDLPGLMEARDVLRRLLDRALELRGRPYLYAWYQLDENLKRRIYGRDYERFLELKAELDPDGLVNPGLL